MITTVCCTVNQIFRHPMPQSQRLCSSVGVVYSHAHTGEAHDKRDKRIGMINRIIHRVLASLPVWAKRGEEFENAVVRFDALIIALEVFKVELNLMSLKVQFPLLPNSVCKSLHDVRNRPLEHCSWRDILEMKPHSIILIAIQMFGTSTESSIVGVLSTQCFQIRKVRHHKNRPVSAFSRGRKGVW